MNDQLRESPKGIAPSSPAWWQFPVHFAVHMLVGTSLFLLIALVALVVALLIKWFEYLQLGWLLINGLKLAEYAIFGVDLFLFLIFLGRTVRRTIKEF